MDCQLTSKPGVPAAPYEKKRFSQIKLRHSLVSVLTSVGFIEHSKNENNGLTGNPYGPLGPGSPVSPFSPCDKQMYKHFMKEILRMIVLWTVIHPIDIGKVIYSYCK